MKEASLVRDCFPHPETPINIEFPHLWSNTQTILQIWRTASSKKTRFIL